MSEVTLELVRAKQNELAAMIEQLGRQAGAEPTYVTVEETDIELQPGEHYAGVVLGQDGEVGHHLVLMAPKPDGDLNWNAAKAWAAGVGGELPTRQEAALLFANCKAHLEEQYHWTSEAYEDGASYAWCCYFGNGNQYCLDQSNKLRARAVRRVNP